jgi:hypothetical protein
LTANIPASDVANPSTAIITVTNPAPGGGASNYEYLSVTNRIPQVALARIDIASGLVGGFGLGSEYTVFSNLVTGDFNGDGRADVAIGEAGGVQALSTFYSTPGICVYMAAGNGSFQDPVCYVLPTQLIPANPGTAFPCQLTIADINGDGKTDLLCNSSNIYYPNETTVFWGNGDGTFQTPGIGTQYNSSQTLKTIVGVADFNRDGKLDMLAIDSSGTTLAIGNGDGTFTAPVTISSLRNSATFGDFNRDGKLDVVITDPTPSAQMQIFLGNGDGTFQPPQAIASLSGLLSAEDINNDGELDLTLLNFDVTSNSNVLSVFLGNGNGTFQAPLNNNAAGDIDFIPPVLGDIDGDGMLDFVDTAPDEGNLAVQFGNGDGNFQTQKTYPAPRGELPALGDFNNDGKMDIAALTADSKLWYLSIFLQGTFPVALVSPSSLNFNEISIGQGMSLPVTLANTGNQAMTISSIGFTGTNSGDFSQTNNCGTSLSTNSSCTINVKFISQGGGSLTASLSIIDNASGSPQAVPIAAVSPDFSITANTSPTATISPGQTATYGITIASVENFVGTVTLGCVGGPPGSTCTVSPGNVPVESPVTATVTVSTPQPGSGFTTSHPLPPHNYWEFATIGFLGMLLLTLRRVINCRKPQLIRLSTFFILGSIIAVSSCGGGGSGGTSGGTYNLTATGTYTANGVTVTHDTRLTLIVK